MASAAKGNLSLLAYIVGAIIQKATDQGAIVHEPVRYCQWAGQLSYSQLRIILKKKFNHICKNDHEAAAKGIGFWAMGEL
jgi:hypothetical protein